MTYTSYFSSVRLRCTDQDCAFPFFCTATIARTVARNTDTPTTMPAMVADDIPTLHENKRGGGGGLPVGIVVMALLAATVNPEPM